MRDIVTNDPTTTDLGELRDRVGNLEDGFETLKTELADNTAATKRIEANTSDLVEAFANLKGAFKVLNWIGKFARPLGYIAGAIAAVVSLYTAFKAGTTVK
ncbi:hypothetical protein [Variovorax sp. IB41]|uniref:hypothetical protein n=1 Tax=Variovorax sp. IB41 TaxID=2779370 RepID=UPI0018E8799B|nr:hypothetical protein [Variovorax sp. IB41]MBJ2155256.1 hypothetical protein [Variovorax sp. IB41]